MIRHHVLRTLEIACIIILAAILLGFIICAIHSSLGYGHVFPHMKV